MTRQKQNQDFLDSSFLYGGNASFIENLYDTYLTDPNSLSQEWVDFFRSVKEEGSKANGLAKNLTWKDADWPIVTRDDNVKALDGDWGEVEENLNQKISYQAQNIGAEISNNDLLRSIQDSIRAIMMVRVYRVRGHLMSTLDPLGILEIKEHPELQPETYGFQRDDWDRKIFIDGMLGMQFATIKEILSILKRTYSANIGIEFMHIADAEEKSWLQERIEGPDKEVSFTLEGKKAILSKLVHAQGFEEFLHQKYVGTKRFGLDGGEAMIPAMEQFIKRGGNLGVEDIIIGMPHRGRLSVLANVMSKPYEAIFYEFLGGSINKEDIEGDVKYHLGASSDREFDGNKVHLSLTANPSHLEAVDPVVLGRVRAKQNMKRDFQHHTVMPLLLHGDAAFAGQGLVAECLGLSDINGHKTGGSIHFIVNNQIGFTAAPHKSRSSPYPSDVAKMVQSPILHCNGDDPESVVFCAKVATEFRQKFHRPVVVDMFCYRRFGHNEGDEPSFTNPIMYKKIKQHPKILDIYSKRLIDEEVLSPEEYETMKSGFKDQLNKAFKAANDYKAGEADWLQGMWHGYTVSEGHDKRGKTGVPESKLKEISEQINVIDDDFNAHKTIKRVFDNRRKSVQNGEKIDWSTAEALAFATLLDEGFGVRLTGQDSERGTFSQRHAVLVDQENENKYIPIEKMVNGKIFEVYSSMLSEFAVLGFEYGYSLVDPNSLVIWEAQFGDFANGAQVIFDQFISSGERKWLRMSGLVLFLPHGYEGQGPEHSSARLERYLQLCAKDNIQIANCTTPANLFHILRRQLHRSFRKPLIIMTPKSLLRHPKAVSQLSDFGEGTSFHRVLYDDAEMDENSKIKLKDDKEIRKVILCSGKVYYDLHEEREKRGINDIYLMRLEQLYPFPARALVKELGRFARAEIVWCQEEPINMGAWHYVESNIEWVLNHITASWRRPTYVGRGASASTATGLMSKHLKELNDFVNEALS